VVISTIHKDHQQLKPKNPQCTYRLHNRYWLPFDQALLVARDLAKQNGVNTERKWIYFKPLPDGLPVWPSHTYKHAGWVSWGHWLGTGNIRGTLRTHNVNDNFFKTWSHDMAYILGFWFADGNICKRKGSGCFIIAQHTKDRYILEKMLDVMSSDYPVFASKTRPDASQFEISSEIIYNDIIALGGMPKKSLKIECPNIPQEFFNDFVRGVFDGDGCISINTKNHAANCYICSGSRSFLEKINAILKDNYNISGRINYYQTCFRLNFGIEQAILLGIMMYGRGQKDALFLERKRLKFDDLISYRMSHGLC
jgi:hypothetical protein